MLFKNYFYVIRLLVVCLNYVNGLCPYAHQFNDVLTVNDVNDITNEIQSAENTVVETYMSSISYDTCQTNCHWYVSQPPPISSQIIENALTSAVYQTEKYTALDVAAAAAAGVSPAPSLIYMDRINYFFESATRYIQETTCSSKETTTLFLPSLQFDNFGKYFTKDKTPVSCDNGQSNCDGKSLVRRVDGSCNNLKRPKDGGVGDCMLRLLAPDYKDGISALRSSVDGTSLPNPKILSDALFGGAENRPFSDSHSLFQALFGEFVIGDNGVTLNHDTAMLFDLQCCDADGRPRIDHPQCAAIFIPPGISSAESYANEKCMRFVRSLPCARCKLGPRMISSSVTAAQDLNSVYGVSDEMLKARRTFKGGCLQSETVSGEEIFAVEKMNGSIRLRCFKGKCEPSPMDARNLFAPSGLVFALLFHRNHNRHARNLSAAYPKWDDEKIFQTARRLNIAEYQHCLYSEYLETLIGENLMQHFALYPEPPGEFSDYEEEVSAKTIVEFQSTAGRHGHTTLIEDVPIIEPKTLKELSLSLRDRDVFEKIFYGGLVDGVLLAQLSKPAFAVTPSIPFKTFSTVTPNVDLAALDIQRQRDHGIPGYAFYLKYFNRADVGSWQDLLQFIDAENIKKLQDHYNHVDDIELYVGGHHERRVDDAITGPTFAHIIALQFHNAKYGDRFFYEHGNQAGSFSIEQLNEIKMKSCFAYILCKNTKLEHVLRNPFRVFSYENQFVSCSEFVDVDYKLL
ncbi:peroxidase-like [Bradysia coprophila]|uniref:peroxidase-like n=1 Tax=Bradysia coprophila TaxID=38358 RepID=UPI00187D8E7C|nr:peroxidase-like [Bradysia coprophila]